MKATRKVETSSLKKKVLQPRTKTSLKKATKQKAVFLKVSTTKDKLNSKLQIITELHTKQNRQPSQKSELVPKSFFASALQLRPKLEVALRSPYRFPIAVESQKLAVGTARYGGVFFVVLGAVATLFFTQALSGAPNGQMALVQLATTSTSSAQVHIDCTDPLQYSSLTCSATVDRTPSAQFEIGGDLSALTSSVRVILKVPFAKSVKLKVRSEATSQFTDLGLMTSPSANSWESYVDTTKLTDGNYLLKAFVTNAYGTYEVVHTSKISIHNAGLAINPTTATTTGQIDTVTTSDTDVVREQAIPVLTALSTVVQNEFKFNIETVGADTVKMYATQLSTKKEIFLGTAYKSLANVWKYRWNASNYADGNYEVKAQIVKEGVASVSGVVTVTKKAVVSTPVLTTETVEVPTPTETKPSVTIDVQANLPLSGSAGLKIDVVRALNVEILAVKDGELTLRYLGSATAVDTDTWVFYIETKNIPNGSYRFIARIKNTFGTYDETTRYMKVANSLPVLTEDQKSAIQEIAEIETEVTSTLIPSSQTEQVHEESDVTVVPTDAGVVKNDTGEETPISTRDFADIQKILEERLMRLAIAVRFGDNETIEKIKSENIPFESTSADEDVEKYQKLQKKVDAYLLEAIKKVEEKVAVTNKIFEERTQEKATLDSDKDGIADYDEITLFKTNPFVADSDADGFLDGVEIEGGYNPNDSSPQALIVYESPKDAGMLRTEILEVVSIATAPAETDAIKTESPTAIISGKGLPNSFVSLYVFSTPVVVSVKTDEEGGWVYRFDKELDNGEHEVYVAVTDNAGKIVAKSKPFSFVKTAEAFTGVTNPNQVAQAPAPLATETSLMSKYMIYLVLSISVVAIGLVLILLGIHLESRARTFKEPEITEQKTA